MIIVVTGTVGLEKKNYLQKVCELAGEKGVEITLCNVGDLMYAEAPDIAKGKILDISMKRLHSIRRSVFKDIIAKSKMVPNVIVNTHATFRWRHGLFPAIDFDQMRQLGADIYVCLIDSADAVHLRLSRDHAVEHSLKDLIVWREEEVFGTEMLCRAVDEKVPFYCLARGAKKDTVETFVRLVFERERKKAYLSFPMTHVVGMADAVKQIEQFREDAKEFFTCFDPANLEEAYLPYYAQKAETAGLDYVEVNVLGETVRFQLAQVKQIERDINSQIYARDFMLIDQSDMIISFIPQSVDGRPVISSGVERELQHAHEAAKEVYVIWTAEKRPSVFVTQTATKVFASFNEAKGYFVKKGYIAQ